MDKKSFKQDWANLLRGWAIIRLLYPGHLLTASASGVLSVLQPLVTIFFSARIIDQLAGERDIPSTALYAGLAVGVTFVFQLAAAFLDRRSRILGCANHFRMTRYRGVRYNEMDFEHVEDSRVNELLTDISERENANGLGIMRLYWFTPLFIKYLFGALASLVLLLGMFGGVPSSSGSSFFTSGWSSVVVVFMIALLLPLRISLMNHGTTVMRKVFDLLPKSNATFHYYYEYINGAGKDIRLFNQQKTVMSLLKARSMAWLPIQSKMTSETAAITSSANVFISGCVYVLIGLRALAGMYTVGQVAQYVGAVTAFTSSLTLVVSRGAMIWENNAYLPLLYRFLDLPDNKYKGSLTVEKRLDNEYEIEFRNVSFIYPGAKEYALRGLNLKFHIGQKLAVVGMNGSGKTTMIKLLCRLYDPTEGEVTLNGIDIRKYDYHEYMSIFSVVFQDFRLFAFPLGQNVAADVCYDNERVADCLSKVGLNSPHLTSNTVLYKDFDEGGVEVSGGEAQKIVLARALYKNAPFIVLDEPTAALDPIAEFEIYSRFNEIVGDKTAIYISHRLSSCRFCDDIAVFHEGELVQRGSHDVLIADEGGKYYELWNAQAQYYNEKAG